MPSPTEEIKSRLDIVDFINEYVRLTPGGANWRARCPFHQEKTPSFMVSRAKGIWHCFGCGKGGDIFAFLQEMEGLSFGEALRVLAKRANVKLTPRDPQLASRRNLLLDILKASVEFTHRFLLTAAEAKPAREYLQRRGLEEATIELFRLGYTPPAWETLKQHLVGAGFREDDIFQAGLTVKRQQGTGSYDRFRGRILFPIHDVHGNPIGFGGRILEGHTAQGVGRSESAEDAGAKYINTPQTLIYDKSSALYGIDRAKQDIRREGVTVVVEGYMDCLASHQAGVRHVVASTGTALTEKQVRLLKRYAPTVFLAFDADAAGQEAAKRGVGQALANELSVKILELPSGKDPDELIRRDVGQWRQAIATAKPALEYFFEATLHPLDLSKLEDKKRATQELLPLIAQAADPVDQTHYLKRLADTVGVDERLLYERVSRRPPGFSPRPSFDVQAPPPVAPVPERDRAALLSERLVALVLKFPEELPYVAEQLSPQALIGEDLKQLYTEAIVWYTERQQFDPADFRASQETKLAERIDMLLMLAEKDFPEENGLSVRRELAAVIQPLKRRQVQSRLREVSQRIQALERSGSNRPELEAALQEFHQLTDELKQLG